MELIKLSLNEIRRKIKSKQVSCAEVTIDVLKQIEKTKNLNSLLTVCGERALAKAREVDEKIAKNQSVGALAGIPIVVKDNISTDGIRTTCASKFLENYTPVYDATVVKKLKEADAIIIGKANMDEFAMGSSNENSAFGAVLNPVDNSRVPGGSSGGSACSVGAFQCYGSLGSDTGGSIRQPASYCGVVGLKPTYSSVSRFGLIAFASSLDQIGPLARNADDCAALYNVISGYDKSDSTSKNMIHPDYEKFSGEIKGKRIGIADEFFSDALGGDVKTSIMSAVKTYESLGASVVRVSIKSFEAALATYYVLSSAEATSNLSRFDGIKYGIRMPSEDLMEVYYKSRTAGFGEEVKRRIMIGNYVLSSGYYDAYYLKASKIRTLIKQDFETALSKCDALICPTAPRTAFKLGQKVTDHTQIYLSDIYTVPVNIAGLPAISLPCGKDKDGLPIGMQLIGKAYDELNLFSLAKAFEQNGKI